MPNVMAALPNISGALCSTPQCGRVPCSNAANTQNPLKFAGVPQTNEMVSAASGPKFTIFLRHVEEILLFNKFFSDCRYVPYLRRYTPTKLCDGAQMEIFLHPVFSASCVQHTSDLHSKFALRLHHMCRSLVDIQSPTAEIKRGIKKKKERK